jgi:hypothetical protein
MELGFNAGGRGSGVVELGHELTERARVGGVATAGDDAGGGWGGCVAAGRGSVSDRSGSRYVVCLAKNTYLRKERKHNL